jgi:hypothetical protein
MGIAANLSSRTGRLTFFYIRLNVETWVKGWAKVAAQKI